MSRKHFSWLLVITVIAAGLVLLFPAKTGNENSFESSELMPGLLEQVNDLEYVRLTAAGNETVATFERREGRWRLRESASYLADWDRLKKLLSDLSQAKITERKTSNVEYYSRLGVEDVTLPDAGGVMVEFDLSTGLPSVIVGNSATGREGQYVRLSGEEGSALIDRNVDVPTDRQQWLDRDIIDISRDEVVEISVAHPDGESFRALKTSADDTDFELQDVPADREISSNWAVNSLAGGLSSLRLDEVTSDTMIDWSTAVVFSLVTADGMRVNAWLLDDPDGPWVRLGASVYQAMDKQIEQDAAAQEQDQDEFAEALTERVNEINERVSGWAYRIPQSSFDTMTKRQEDLLKPLEES